MRRPTNPLALAVLCLLTEKPMHPYEMSSTMHERHHEQSIRVNYGSLYSVVESLAKKGLIEATRTVREGRRPERTIYAITDPGLEALTEWLGEMLRVPTPQFTDLEAALALMGALPPDDVLDHLRHRLQELRLQRVSHEAIHAAAPPGFPRMFLIEGEYQAALRDAETAFVESLVRDIESGELGGLQLWRRIHELRDAGTPPEEIQPILAEEFDIDLTWPAGNR